jgi:hypothetical protein
VLFYGTYPGENRIFLDARRCWMQIKLNFDWEGVKNSKKSNNSKKNSCLHSIYNKKS